MNCLLACGCNSRVENAFKLGRRVSWLHHLTCCPGKPRYCSESQSPGLSNRVNMLFEGLVFFSSCPSSLIPHGQCPHDRCICLTFLPLFLSYQTLIQDEANFLPAFCLPKCLWALWKKTLYNHKAGCVIVYCPQPASLTLVCSWVWPVGGGTSRSLEERWKLWVPSLLSCRMLAVPSTMDPRSCRWPSPSAFSLGVRSLSLSLLLRTRRQSWLPTVASHGLLVSFPKPSFKPIIKLFLGYPIWVSICFLTGS